MTQSTICIIGGTGFVGGHLVCELTRRQHATRVLTRRRERNRHLLVYPLCDVVERDVHDPEVLREQFEGCDAVINLAGILNEPLGSGGAFEAVHAALPGTIAAACRDAGVPRLLHMSSLGAGAGGPSEYLRSKGRGEEAAHTAGGDQVAVTSFRPSVIFGPGDSFFNRFATLLRISPVLPLACPDSRMAPAFVEDVVRAFALCLEDKSTWGARYDLCGPRQYTLRELVEYTARVAGMRRLVIGLNDGLSRLQAQVLDHVPGKPFSTDNYLSLQVDSICRGDNGFAALGIEPAAVESVVPTYLGRRDRRARYQSFRTHARRD